MTLSAGDHVARPLVHMPSTVTSLLVHRAPCTAVFPDGYSRPGWVSFTSDGASHPVRLTVDLDLPAPVFDRVRTSLERVELSAETVIEVDEVLDVQASYNLLGEDPEDVMATLYASPSTDAITVVSAAGDETTSVVGHLFNVPHYRGAATTVRIPNAHGGVATLTCHDRLRLTAAGWVLELDSIRPWVFVEGAAEASQRGLGLSASASGEDETAQEWQMAITEARRGGASLITHVVRLSKSSSGSFNSKDGNRTLRRIEAFLSFVFGRRMPITYRFGLDRDGHERWRRFSMTHRIGDVSGRVARSWLPGPVLGNGRGLMGEQTSTSLSEALDGFIHVDRNHPEILERAIEWYVSALASTGTPGCIVLAQAGLELLAYHRLCNELRMSDDGRQALRASDQIRVLLSGVVDDLRIPAELHSLEDGDGPDCVTRARNRAVHPGAPPRQKSPAALEREAHVAAQTEALALQYFELSLLRLVGYRGDYWDRVSRQVRGVPWAT